MKNPDILTALMMLRAADTLNMDIEVDIDDVMDAFDITENANPFPFPF